MTSVLNIWGRWDVLPEIYIEMFKKKKKQWIDGWMEGWRDTQEYKCNKILKVAESSGEYSINFFNFDKCQIFW